ncbi:MAG: TRAM domain-containing protein [Gammaproteobacteria bacterium]|nr:TRAM domain-containing protein [Gammaproteobacteria bacterium]MDH5802767.1 TRAM domain-containing protein [Gammaproteobacteria bacterium]
MKIGDTLELIVADISRGGAGVSRTPKGLTVFTPGTVSGETIRARIIEKKAKFANAELLEILAPSPQRQQPICPVFGQCGGCQWQHLPYELQWQIKLSGVQQVLKSNRIKGKFSIDEYPADKIWNYRNRVQLRGHNKLLGYYAARTHNIINIHQCPIAHPNINAALESVRTQGALSGKPYKVELEALADEGIRSVWNQNHGAAGFRQINDEQNLKLKHWIQQALITPQPLLDLYGGSANLSWQLGHNRDVSCVDLSAPQQAPIQCPPRIRFYRSDILPWLKQQITDIRFKRKPMPKLSCSAILDPPRGGLGSDFGDIAERLEFLKANEIVAVGCKTDSWARDVAGFMQRGWSVKKIAVFDFFPHTVHIETVALLSRLV